MTPTTRHRLLEDTLHPDALAESLAATRRSARHRRLTRRVVRTGAIGMVIGATWLGVVRPRPSVMVGTPPDLPPPTVTSSRPPHLLVTTQATTAPVLVHTMPTPAGSTAPERVNSGVLIVSTRSDSPAVPRATEDDLFAAAGARPAALHRLPNGSAKWVWLDRDTRW